MWFPFPENYREGVKIVLPYCDQCEDVVEFEQETKLEQKTIKGKELSYLGKEAYCKECGSLVFVPELHDHNLRQINDAYK